MERVQGLSSRKCELELATKPNGFNQPTVWLMINIKEQEQ